MIRIKFLNVSMFSRSSFRLALVFSFLSLAAGVRADWGQGDIDAALQQLRSLPYIQNNTQTTEENIRLLSDMIEEQLVDYRSGSSSTATLRYILWNMLKYQGFMMTNEIALSRDVRSSSWQNLPSIYRFQPHSYYGQNLNFVTNLQSFLWGSSSWTANSFPIFHFVSEGSRPQYPSTPVAQNLASFLNLGLGGFYEDSGKPSFENAYTWDATFLHPVNNVSVSARRFFTFWLAEAMRRNIATNSMIVETLRDLRPSTNSVADFEYPPYNILTNQARLGFGWYPLQNQMDMYEFLSLALGQNVDRHTYPGTPNFDVAFRGNLHFFNNWLAAAMRQVISNQVLGLEKMSESNSVLVQVQRDTNREVKEFRSEVVEELDDISDVVTDEANAPQWTDPYQEDVSGESDVELAELEDEEELEMQENDFELSQLESQFGSIPTIAGGKIPVMTRDTISQLAAVGGARLTRSGAEFEYYIPTTYEERLAYSAADAMDRVYGCIFSFMMLFTAIRYVQRARSSVSGMLPAPDLRAF